jgi:transcription elongation GreA/GreB family factor
MSKAFTKEDDDAGFAFEAGPARVVSGPVTALGSRLAHERLAALARLEGADRAEGRAALERERQKVTAIVQARVAHAPDDPGVVGFGASVRVRDAAGKERVVVVASPEEIGLVPQAASATSPIAQALLGARAGESVEFDGPRGPEELAVVAVAYPA